MSWRFHDVSLRRYINASNRCVIHSITLHWRHNGSGSVLNHQPHNCLLNRLFRRRSKKTSKLRVTGLCAGNSPGTGEFPTQMASNAENVSIWWRHHGWRELGLYCVCRCQTDGARPSAPTDNYKVIHVHDDVIKWEHFPRYWPFVRGILRPPVNSSHKGQWRGALEFSMICGRINVWGNNREAGDLRRYRAQYDVIVMYLQIFLAMMISKHHR